MATEPTDQESRPPWADSRLNSLGGHVAPPPTRTQFLRYAAVTMADVVHIWLAVAIAILVSVAAVRLQTLTVSGGLAAAVVGNLVLAGGGWTWAILLALFFLSSSALSRLPANTDGIAAKTSKRDWAQVVANGGIPALVAALSFVHESRLWLTAAAGALAAATGDTWATEIGRRAGGMPSLITTGQRVRPGTSGGVTRLGWAAAAGGSALIGIASVVVGNDLKEGAGVMGAGLVGALSDSILGVALQERRECTLCLVRTEQTIHAPCGTRTAYVGGVRGLNNDLVNLVSCAIGAACAIAFVAVS